MTNSKTKKERAGGRKLECGGGGVVEQRKEKFDLEERLGERKRESKMRRKRRTEQNVERGRACWE